MKQIFLSLLAVATLVSCNKVGKNEFTIEGSADGVKDGVAVYLQKQDSTGWVQLDTVKVENGKFKFEGDVTEPSLHFIQIDSTMGKVIFVLENGAINLKVNKDSINKSVVSGTHSNDKLTTYSKEYEKIQKKMMAFRESNMQKWDAAQAAQDTVTRNALIKENQSFQEQFLKLTIDHVENNPKSYLALMFIGQLMNQPDRDVAKLTKYFENLDPELKNTKEGKKIKKGLTEMAEAEKKSPVAMPLPQQ
ncbi:DUF4369 domain-containing protein [Flavobacterium soli]|uniref:DUF4369 domain-containing protein n=1 Tax=Flavobacterium soli TaxID=344881 RepID=UPI00040C29CA|nr:DUF4369 domain-containing protein [Flavobacterium soli]